MVDKVLLNRISDGECSFDELDSFVNSMDEVEFDTDNPFDNYYRLDRILAVIERFRAKEIDNEYLKCWLTAYCYIVMGGLKGNDDSPIYLKDFIRWKIADWMDNMAFGRIKCDYECVMYETAFTTLDKVYRECDGCQAVFAHFGLRKGDILAYVYNKQSKYFIKVYSRLYNVNGRLAAEIGNIDDIRNCVRGLTEHGYREIHYGVFDDDDD